MRREERHSFYSPLASGLMPLAQTLAIAAEALMNNVGLGSWFLAGVLLEAAGEEARTVGTRLLLFSAAISMSSYWSRLGRQFL
jgi:hypothetical protein